MLRGGALDGLNYLVGRFTADYRLLWLVGQGPFRHENTHGLLVEGSIHHFDMLRNLAGADRATLTGMGVEPGLEHVQGGLQRPLSDGDDQRRARLLRGVGDGGRRAELLARGEYYRAECEGGAVAVGRDRAVRIHRLAPGGGLVTEEVPPLRVAYDGHQEIVDQFLTWLEGGPTPPTALEDNIQSTAMLFGAIKAAARRRCWTCRRSC